MTRLARFRFTALASAIAVLIAACSGGSSTSGSGGEPSSATADGEIRMTQITVGDLTFEAREAGPDGGELVLLLHGFPTTSAMWRNQLEALGEAGYHAVAPDQRGYSPGARPTEVEDYALAKLAEDAVGIADALGAERFNLVGHDFGGAVAWTAAANSPDRLISVTSVSTPHLAALGAAIQSEGSDQSDRSSYVAVFVQDGSEQIFLNDDASLLRRLYADAGLSETEMEAQLSVMTDPDAMIAALNWYRATTFGSTDPPGPSTVPTMFIWSNADAALGPDAAFMTAEFVTGPYRFEIIDRVNHWIPEVAPDEVSALLLDFLVDPAGGDTEAPITSISNVHDSRYCEILLVAPGEGAVVAEVYATLGTNDCPAEQWEAIDLAAIGAERGAVATRNGPRHWLADRVTKADAAGEATTFGDLQFRLAATLLIEPGADQLPLQERAVERSTRFTFDAGTEVYELTDPDGRVFVMQSYSLEVDPALSLADLAGLGDRIALPEGWSFAARTLEEDLVVTDIDGIATVIQDDLSNTYQLVAN